MDDFPLFDSASVPRFVVAPFTGTIDDAFRAFHAANPWVYDALVELTRDLISRGHVRIGIGMLFEVLRWHWHRATVDPSSEFKLNNSYRSRYARLIMSREEDLAGVFELRRLTAA
jgi:hypothetical protein